MSALSPHIRVLRAEADALFDQAQSLRLGEHFAAALVVLAMGDAKRAAANALETEEAALKPPREGVDVPITYNPKGRR